MERTVVIRHRVTGLYVGAAACTADARAALRFRDAETARRFVGAHACEPQALEVIERTELAAA